MEPMEEEIDADTETVETMTAGLIKHIFGKGEEGIKEQLSKSQDLPRDIGSLAYTLVDAAADQATKAGREFDLDMLMGVVTEIIDSVMQLAEALGVIDDADDDELREFALMSAVEAYIASGEPSPDEVEAAKQMLAGMSESGDVDEAASTLKRMGASRGEDPFAEDAPAEGAPPEAPVDAPPEGMQPPGNAPIRPALMQE